MAPRASGPGKTKPRRPVWLEHQSIRSGRHGAHQVIEQHFGFDTLRLGQSLLAQSELLLEPGHHPVTAVDLDLKTILSRHCCRIWGDERDDFDIFLMGGVNGCGRSVTQTPDVRFEAACAQYLGGFVSCGRDERQSRRDAGDGRSLGE